MKNNISFQNTFRIGLMNIRDKDRKSSLKILLLKHKKKVNSKYNVLKYIIYFEIL